MAQRDDYFIGREKWLQKGDMRCARTRVVLPLQPHKRRGTIRFIKRQPACL